MAHILYGFLIQYFSKAFKMFIDFSFLDYSF